MNGLEREIHRNNLRTAWGMCGGWPADHQEKLTELVVKEFVAVPQDEPEEAQS